MDAHPRLERSAHDALPGHRRVHAYGGPAPGYRHARLGEPARPAPALLPLRAPAQLPRLGQVARARYGARAHHRGQARRPRQVLRQFHGRRRLRHDRARLRDGRALRDSHPHRRAQQLGHGHRDPAPRGLARQVRHPRHRRSLRRSRARHGRVERAGGASRGHRGRFRPRAEGHGERAGRSPRVHHQPGNAILESRRAALAPPGRPSMTRIAYFNGTFVPETEVVIPFRDRSFNRGDGCFDMTRTFDGRIFRLEEHVERLYRSLRYLRIDIGLEPKEVVAISEEVVEKNERLRAAAGDWWLAQRISRGVDAIGDEGWEHTGPQVIVDCTPLPFSARARQFRDGIDVVVPSIRRIPPPMLSPRAKTHNYLNLILADKEVKSSRPDAWSVLLDENGNLCEGIGSNIFVVKEQRVFTPREKYVLPGVSRRTVMDMAANLGIACEERDLDVYDAVTADEVFLTSTSLCICGVRSVNGGTIGDGAVPGPITKRLTQAYVKHVGCDFVSQYLSRLT